MSKISAYSNVSVPALADYVIGDAASGPTTGTFLNARLLALLGVLPGGRLTAESGVPASRTNQLAKGTLYYTPYLHDRVRLYDGTRWKVMVFAEISLSFSGLFGIQSTLSTTTTGASNVFTVASTTGLYVGQPVAGTSVSSGTYIEKITSGTAGLLSLNASSATTTNLNYYNGLFDVFLYDNSGTVALELLAWTDATTRATALVRQDGVLVKSGTPTRLYVGTIGASDVDKVEDSSARLLIWNMYNRLRRNGSSSEATSHTLNNTAAREWVGALGFGPRVHFVTGLAEDCVIQSFGVYAVLSSNQAYTYYGGVLDTTFGGNLIRLVSNVTTPGEELEQYATIGWVAPVAGRHYTSMAESELNSHVFTVYSSFNNTILQC